MKRNSHFESTRFFYIQEGIGIGLFAAIAKTFFATFPILELFGFVGPILTVAFTLKTWQHTKEANGQK